MVRYPYINRVVTAAAGSEPLTAAEAKNHCRVDVTDDDTLITNLIVAARTVVERYTGRVLIDTTLKAYGDCFADEMVIPDPPLIAVTGVTYIDEDGVEQTLSTDVYQVSAGIEPARIWLKYNQTWPAVRVEKQAVRIAYRAGWANAAAVPQPLKQAMLLLIGAWYEHREEIITGTIVASLPVPVAARALMGLYRTGFIWTGEPVGV